MTIKQNRIVEKAYEASLDLLHSLSTPKGFLASNNEAANYKRIWARDGVITGLAALRSGDKKLIRTFAKTLDTLKRAQDHTGRIPSNISLDGKNISYGMTVGRIDATIWYVIGVCQYTLATNDGGLWRHFQLSVQDALHYLDCLELNGRGLLYIPHGADWADEYLNHGYVLFDQALRYIALLSYYRLTKKAATKRQLAKLKRLIEINFFPGDKPTTQDDTYYHVTHKLSLRERVRPFPIPHFTNHSVHHHIDNFAIALVLQNKLLDSKRAKTLAKAVTDKFLKKETDILPAFHPVITPKSNKWGQLKCISFFHFRNKPYEYHNGGLWPLVHGFFISALRRQAGQRRHLANMSSKLQQDKFGFPEYYHGQTGKPGGTKGLGLSAAAYILAHQAIIKNYPTFDL
ncbi:MAG: glycoside hydrolase 100 family protein [Patescibacteria group bacterium]|nr:glycoside hydrolase 100 family protein [Patescibacteria group bacterium]